jgi:urocanate hydratase
MFCADMSVQNVIGDGFRGATWVSLHNGGGVGWGEVINGGFGLVLDGSDRVDAVIRSGISWDVMGGVARRAWARNEHALGVAIEHNRQHQGTEQITIPYVADQELVSRVVEDRFGQSA